MKIARNFSRHSLAEARMADRGSILAKYMTRSITWLLKTCINDLTVTKTTVQTILLTNLGTPDSFIDQNKET